MEQVHMKSVATIALLLALCACGPAMDEASKNVEATAAELEKAVGVKPSMGYSIQNGELAYVQVRFPAKSVGQYRIDELEGKVRDATLKNFPKPPREIIISIHSSP